ncbi:MAG: hypothetical protein IPG68_16215 [Micrococcales bacterium]|nr:hypothetical protein [Micrococcales bacterium]
MPLVEDRRRFWQTLYLSRVHEAQLTALHRADPRAAGREVRRGRHRPRDSLDDIARAMSELATSSRAPAGAGGDCRRLAARAPAAPAEATPAAETARPGLARPADDGLCNDWDLLPGTAAVLRQTTVVIDGEARVIARMIPGAADSVGGHPEIAKRIDRVRANCDAEIIR